MRARGMHDLRDLATALYLFKINSVVSSTITFATQACATLAPYTKDMAREVHTARWCAAWPIPRPPSNVQLRPFQNAPAQLYSSTQAPTSHKIFIALMKGELKNSRHRQRSNPGEYTVEGLLGVSGHDAIPETPLVIC